MPRFCIYCGKEGTQDNPVINGVCLKCRLKRGELIKFKKDHVRIDICRICYSIKIGFKWIETKGFEDALAKIVDEVMPKIIEPGVGVNGYYIDRFELVTKASWKTIVRIYVKVLYGNVITETPMDITVYLNPVKCPRCKMYDSREFEAVVQIRGYSLHYISRALEKIFLTDHRLSKDLIEAVRSHSGIDVYFYSHGAARKLARRLAHMLNAHIVETYEEAGMRSGRQRARLYISLKPKT